MAELDLPRTWGGKLKAAIIAVNDELETVDGSVVSTPADYRNEHYTVAGDVADLEGSTQIILTEENLGGPTGVDDLVTINEDGFIVVARAGLYAVCLSGGISNLAADEGGPAELSLQPPDQQFFYTYHAFPLNAGNGYSQTTVEMLTALGLDSPGTGGWITGLEGWKAFLTKHVALEEGELLGLFASSGMEPPAVVEVDFLVDIYPVLFI